MFLLWFKISESATNANILKPRDKEKINRFYYLDSMLRRNAHFMRVSIAIQIIFFYFLRELFFSIFCSFLGDFVSFKSISVANSMLHFLRLSKFDKINFLFTRKETKFPNLRDFNGGYNFIYISLSLTEITVLAAPC